MTLDQIEADLLRAHAEEDLTTLIQLYTRAADIKEVEGDIDAACFYLTHAYVFALQAGVADAPSLQTRLWKHGREVAPDGL
jgi:hypothetical protein